MTMNEDTELRADQWHTMTLQQLNHERDKVINKLNLLHGMVAGNVTSQGLYLALDHALNYLNGLIDNRTQQ